MLIKWISEVLGVLECVHDTQVCACDMWENRYILVSILELVQKIDVLEGSFDYEEKREKKRENERIQGESLISSCLHQLR